MVQRRPGQGQFQARLHQGQGRGDQAHQGLDHRRQDDRHQVGLPNHWGFVKGVTKPGYLVNTLTPFVGDGNTQTPEFKSFLVKVEKA
jgi:anaerobic selenocysteine-containing dehydrogenase